jgi:hypothetical protein
MAHRFSNTKAQRDVVMGLSRAFPKFSETEAERLRILIGLDCFPEVASELSKALNKVMDEEKI